MARGRAGTRISQRHDALPGACEGIRRIREPAQTASRRKRRLLQRLHGGSSSWQCGNRSPPGRADLYARPQTTLSGSDKGVARGVRTLLPTNAKTARGVGTGASRATMRSKPDCRHNYTATTPSKTQLCCIAYQRLYVDISRIIEWLARKIRIFQTLCYSSRPQNKFEPLGPDNSADHTVTDL